jgi:hypothetical protein
MTADTGASGHRNGNGTDGGDGPAAGGVPGGAGMGADTPGAGAGAVEAAVAGELLLLDPAVRASPERAGRLLDPEFTEVGRSGRQWTYTTALAALAREAAAPEPAPRHEPSGLRGVLLAPDLVHLTYETGTGGARTRRSSLWRRTAGSGDWRMYYHQATPVPEHIE